MEKSLMWSDTYQNAELNLDIELTTNCNARCPQCSSTDEINVNKRKDWLPLQQVSIEVFKKWFPITNSIKNFHFSGKFGDPGMCKDLKEIVEYIINSNDTSTISINTNGSMRDEDFWFSLGLLGKERIHIIFDVDGIDQKMHEFYRRGTNLKKVLSNLEATCQTLAKVSVLTVMFKHNENYIEDIQNMCRKLGVKNFDTVEGNAFWDGPNYDFIDEDGNKQVLEQITRKDREQGLERSDRRVRDHRHWHKPYKEIVCLAAKDKNLQVTSKGLVMPCCHLSTLEKSIFYKRGLQHDEYISTNGNDDINPTMKDFIDNDKDFNLNYNTIDSIVNNVWYKEKLQKSWQSETSASFACKNVCGVC